MEDRKNRRTYAGQGQSEQGSRECKLATVIRCLSRGKANDSGWPTFKGKYVEYTRFRKE